MQSDVRERTFKTFRRGQGKRLCCRRAALESLPFAGEVGVIWRDVLRKRS